MSDRYFENNFPDIPSSQQQKEDEEENEHQRACRIADLDPYSPSHKKLLQAALSLKEQVVQATWAKRGAWVADPILYTGLLGTAFLCFRAYETCQNMNDLDLCIEITDKCAAAGIQMKQYVTFICGQGGIYALGAAAAKYKGDEQRLQYYLGLFNEVANEPALSVGPSEGGLGMPYELLYGRAGFLWAALFINKYVGAETIPWSTTGPIVDAVLAAGRACAYNACPLMYQWHGTRYWGAAHGLAGIMHVLMHFPLGKEDVDDVKGTLHYMIKNRFQHTGNYRSSEGNTNDRLVHWCHGAPGITMTLCKAAEAFPVDEDFKEAAVAAGDVVWKCGLLRRVGLCHGISGNTYAFLSLYRLTGDKFHLHRAKCFSSFLYTNALGLIASGKMHGGDHPHSLFEGLAGSACLWLDMLRPHLAKFPGYEL